MPLKVESIEQFIKKMNDIKINNIDQKTFPIYGRTFPKQKKYSIASKSQP
jgi:hypothetical protein